MAGVGAGVGTSRVLPSVVVIVSNVVGLLLMRQGVWCLCGIRAGDRRGSPAPQQGQYLGVVGLGEHVEGLDVPDRVTV